jgi:2-haloacid dehalogenase
VVAFDVNETLSDMQGLVPRFEDIGAPPGLLDLWFAQTLRDGFALTAAGAYADFSTIASACLSALFDDVPDLDGSPDEAAAHVVGGLGELDLHPDVAPAMRSLADTGMRIVTLSNGAAHVSEMLLERGGLRQLVERCLSAADTGKWKPDASAYRLAAEQCDAEPGEFMLIAVHPWDIDGAARAGLLSGGVARTGGEYPSYFRAPGIRERDLGKLVASLQRAG